ncbi:1-aminocyclopropane-1-carboxylate synthase-like [Elaeis guineensis]|uniref:1-aminocyclopropane-1-carboxylate synthase n=1 Tax=Elaeis guineensis var. tenera TaxID=51953 RepID=A0A6I9R2M6_ELAGV|nr:1-aminocyclopropane-1-carboxylate synthase-like [Elaeis guineensis]
MELAVELRREPNSPLLSKMATSDGHGENSSYFDGWKAYDCDPFHPTSNPEGVIQLGLAENQLCLDPIQEWIKNNPKASICTEVGVSEFKNIANFQDYHGLRVFREAVAKFMRKVRGGRSDFHPDRIVMSGGATGAAEVIAFCLADPGEAFLVPTPYYPAFDRDLRWRTGIQVLPIQCKSSNHFKITRTALESAYEKAQKANVRVKAVMVANPSNPLGTILDRETLRMLVNFTNGKRIHLICDEIFAGTVFKDPQFVSVSEIVDEDPNCDRSLIHITYSLSKDLGLPGFRVGVVYSYNDTVVRCARRMSSFGLVSSQTQYLLASMLSDDEFTTKLIEEVRRRLSKRHELFTSRLAKVGIQCLESNAGLFCWMDLRRLLKEFTVEGELELWRVIINDVKLNVSPGSSFHCHEPGWFRVCFANMDDETMDVALGRIESFVLRTKEAAVQAKKKKWKQDGLRLSLPRRFEDMATMTSSLMSPHSPLVPATTSALVV